MNMRRRGRNRAQKPVVVRWETNTAEFIQIDVSPMHILRIKIDKVKR